MIYLANTDLEHQITQLGTNTVLIACAILAVATILAVLFKDRAKFMKLPLFLIMAGTMVVSTGILLVSTVYLNVKSESGGPVHWHTDIEYWVCGTELEFRDPTGFLSNKIGTATYHEHNDKRIHLEGVVVRRDVDSSLTKFMEVTGGYIAPDRIGIPLNEDSSTWFANEANDKTDGDPQGNLTPGQISAYVSQSAEGPVLELKNGQNCGDQPAELQTFLFSYNDGEKTYTQTKLADPSDYLMRDESNVPPGDCVIVEFDVKKDFTDKLCRQYGVRDIERCQEFGVVPFNPDLCELQQITKGAE